MGKSGESWRISRQTPMSCAITASAPAPINVRKYSSASLISSANTSVLNVMYPLTPRPWRYSINRGRSAAVKLSALMRALKRSRPK